MVVSPDGSVLAYADGRTIVLVDAATGFEVRWIAAHSGDIAALAFSGDGSRLLSAASYDLDRFHRALKNPEELRRKLDERFAKAMASGTLLPEVDEQDARERQEFLDRLDNVKLWEVETGKELGALKGLEWNGRFAAFCAGGAKAVAADETALVIWESASRKIVSSATLSASTGTVLAGVDPGCRNALAFERKRPWFTIIDAQSGQLVRKIDAPSPVTAATFVADGRMVALGFDGGGVTFFDLATGKFSERIPTKGPYVDVLRGSLHAPAAVAVSSGNEEMVALAGKSGAGKVMWQKGKDPFGESLGSAAISADGETLFSTALWPLTKISRWRIASGARDYQIEAIAADQELMFTASSHEELCAAGGKISCWNLASGQLARQTDAPAALWMLRPMLENGPQGAVAPDGSSYFVIAANTVVQMDSGSNRAIRTFSAASTNLTALGVSGAGKRVAACAADGTVTVWDTGSGRTLSSFRPHDKPVQSLVFSPDETMLACGDGMSRLENAFEEEVDRHVLTLWDSASGALVHELRGAATAQGISFNDDGSLVAAGYGNDVLAWDTANGRLRWRAEGHGGLVQATRFLPGRKDLLLSAGADRRMLLWDGASGKPLASLFSMTDGTWLVVDPDGRFDTNNLEQIKGMQWVMPDAPLKPLPLDIFMRDYYEPRLLARILAGEKLRPVRDLSTLNRAQPEVAVAGIERSGQDTVDVAVTVRPGRELRARRGQAVALTSAAHDLKLFRDRQLVGLHEGEVVATTANSRTVVFKNIRLPRREGGKAVEFSAYAFNDDGVKSVTSRSTFALPAELKAATGKAYLINIGVNEYQSAAWQLRFAVNDATLVNGALRRQLEEAKRYRQVVSVLLRDQQATKENLAAIFARLAGKETASGVLAGVAGAELLAKAVPEDLVIVTYSGHGHADGKGAFYLFPHDIGASQERVVGDALLGKLVSSKELEEWYRPVDAGELALVIDACHSAASVGGDEFKPGPMGSRGLGQLAFDKGMRILTASQADDVALEDARLQQGLLTYALVHDGLGAFQADFKPKDGAITLTEWLAYGVERVPALAEEVRRGEVQDFGLSEESKRGVVRVKHADDEGSAAGRAIQQPSLFDFTRNRAEITLATGAGAP